MVSVSDVVEGRWRAERLCLEVLKAVLAESGTVAEEAEVAAGGGGGRLGGVGGD